MAGYSKTTSDDLPPPERLPPPSKSGLVKSKTESEKITNFLTGLAEKSGNPDAVNFVKKAEPALKAVIKGVIFVWPYYKKIYGTAYEYYHKLPENILYMVFGAALCFFGGTYVASIAAIEAFRQLGWQTVQTNLTIIYEDTQTILAASEVDDKVDKDGDNVADVDQMDPVDLVQHKIIVGMTAVKNPERLQTASGALFASYLAVLATLRLEFARTTAFALGIVEMAKYPIVRTVAPAVATAIGPELGHWTETLVTTALTFVAVIFAWFLQMIISAFYSGLRGGKIFADALIKELSERQLMEKVPFITQPFDPDDSYLDEAVGYSLAAVGFGFQIFNGFSLPFPLNLIFLPLTIIEWFLRFQISMESAGGLSG